MNRDYEIRVFDPETGGAVPLTKGDLEKIMPDLAEIDDDFVAAIVEAFEGVCGRNPSGRSVY